MSISAVAETSGTFPSERERRKKRSPQRIRVISGRDATVLEDALSMREHTEY